MCAKYILYVLIPASSCHDLFHKNDLLTVHYPLFSNLTCIALAHQTSYDLFFRLCPGIIFIHNNEFNECDRQHRTSLNMQEKLGPSVPVFQDMGQWDSNWGFRLHFFKHSLLASLSLSAETHRCYLRFNFLPTVESANHRVSHCLSFSNSPVKYRHTSFPIEMHLHLAGKRERRNVDTDRRHIIIFRRVLLFTAAEQTIFECHDIQIQ